MRTVFSTLTKSWRSTMRTTCRLKQVRRLIKPSTRRKLRKLLLITERFGYAPVLDSLCNLCGICLNDHHRGTEDTEIAQRRSSNGAPRFAVRRHVEFEISGLTHPPENISTKQ